MLAPKLTRSVAEARLPPGVPEDVLQLNSNENPYGPSAKALEAMTKSQRWASRYPGQSRTASERYDRAVPWGRPGLRASWLWLRRDLAHC